MLEQPEVQTEEVTIFQDQLHQAIVDIEAGIEARYAIEQQRLSAELERYKAHAETVKREIERAAREFDTVSAEIVMLIDGSSVQLGSLMRKRGEAAGLRSYLAGLRFLAGA
jgi:hypothetical protein